MWWKIRVIEQAQKKTRCTQNTMSCDVNDNAPEEISEYATFRQRSPLLDCFAFALLFALNLAPFFCGGDDVPDDDQTFFIYLRTFKQGSQAKGHCHVL